MKFILETEKSTLPTIHKPSNSVNVNHNILEAKIFGFP